MASSRPCGRGPREGDSLVTARATMTGVRRFPSAMATPAASSSNAMPGALSATSLQP